MLRSRVQPLDDWVSIVVSQDLSPDARQKAVAGFAREKLKEAQDINQRALGHVPPHEQFVDGRKGAALETVDRTIVFEFELVADVLSWIWAELRKRSPRGPAGGAGTYRDAHKLFADGREIPPGTDVPAASEYSFSNVVPYARRLEIGQTKSGRPFLIQVENRIYDRVSFDAAARFSNIARIGFTYRGIVGGAMVRGRAGNKSSLRYPTITVRPR